MQTAVDAALSRRRILRSLLNDILFVLILIVPVVVCEYTIEPFRRGFFCNDDSIRYPYHPNTIDTSLLMTLVLVIPILLIFIVEFMRWYIGNEYGKMSPLLGRCHVPSWLFDSVHHYLCYSIGFLIQIDITEVAKFTIGRLRPHFWTVCEPDILDGTTCSDPHNANGRYIEDYVCTATGFGEDTASVQHQARLSFPSGHSSLITYGMIYMSLYLESRFRWPGTQLLRYVFQTLMILIIWFVTLTRISDYWHHPTDVLAGALIGTCTAVLTGLYKTKLFPTKREYIDASNEYEYHYHLQQQQLQQKQEEHQQQYPLKLPLQQTSVNHDALQQVVTTMTPYQ